MGITEILMNYLYCHGFEKNKQSTVILTLHISLVSYYLPKQFVIVETKESGLDNVTIRVQKKISEVSKHDEDIFLP